MAKVMITTVDNPYSPFTQTDLWRSFDVDQGYYTREYLARIAKTAPEMTDADYDDEIERAIDDIIKYDPLKIYKKVTENDYKT